MPQSSVNDLASSPPSFFKILGWDTPATHYPNSEVGTARIIHRKEINGFYMMEGVRGFDYYSHPKSIPITHLQIRKKTWMVDDPLHWMGMQDLAKAARGSVLVGGLGLGLVVHALSTTPDVSKVKVVELNKDVAELVWPLVPHVGTELVVDDVMKVIYESQTNRFDTIILDIWVYGQDDDPDERIHVGYQMLGAIAVVKHLHPKSKLFIWGMRDPEYNPAVTNRPHYLGMKVPIHNLQEVP